MLLHVSLDAAAILDKILGIISKVIKWTHFETMSPTVLLSLFNGDYNPGNDQKTCGWFRSCLRKGLRVWNARNIQTIFIGVKVYISVLKACGHIDEGILKNFHSVWSRGHKSWDFNKIFSIFAAVNNLFLGEGRHTIAHFFLLVIQIIWICYIASTSEKKVISTILISHPSRYQ